VSGLFAYGTLQHADVLCALLGGAPRPAAAARLDGYRRGPLRGEPYPGILPASEASTAGVLYTQLCREDFEILDLFEGPVYERIEVEVWLAEGGRARACAYEVRAEHRSRVAPDAWSFERFCAKHASAYVQSCRALRQQHLSRRRSAT